jgi:hypothetical protein
MAVVYAEDLVRTNDEAHATAHAFILVQLQRNNILQIDELTHF